MRDCVRRTCVPLRPAGARGAGRRVNPYVFGRLILSAPGAKSGSPIKTPHTAPYLRGPASSRALPFIVINLKWDIYLILCIFYMSIDGLIYDNGGSRGSSRRRVR